MWNGLQWSNWQGKYYTDWAAKLSAKMWSLNTQIFTEHLLYNRLCSLGYRAEPNGQVSCLRCLEFSQKGTNGRAKEQQGMVRPLCPGLIWEENYQSAYSPSFLSFPTVVISFSSISCLLLFIFLLSSRVCIVAQPLLIATGFRFPVAGKPHC